MNGRVGARLCPVRDILRWTKRFRLLLKKWPEIVAKDYKKARNVVREYSDDFILMVMDGVPCHKDGAMNVPENKDFRLIRRSLIHPKICVKNSFRTLFLIPWRQWKTNFVKLWIIMPTIPKPSDPSHHSHGSVHSMNCNRCHTTFYRLGVATFQTFHTNSITYLY